MNRLPPPATRLSTPKNPPPPIIWVWVVMLMELDIQESSPASEMMASFGCSRNSSTGMVVPTMRLCMMNSPMPESGLNGPAFEGSIHAGSLFPASEHIQAGLASLLTPAAQDRTHQRQRQCQISAIDQRIGQRPLLKERNDAQP